MNQKRTASANWILLFSMFSAIFLYILFIVNPTLWFHKVQPPFLTTTDFLLKYLKNPGGVSNWISNLFTQIFYFQIGGVIAFFLLNTLLFLLIYFLLEQFQKKYANNILALFPIFLITTLASNYQFSFSTVFSILFVIIALLALFRIKNQLIFLAGFLLSAIFIFYVAGSGFLWVYAVSVFISVIKKNNSIKWLNLVYVLLISYLVIWISNSFILSSTNQHGYFTFIGNESSEGIISNLLFYIYVFSIPVLLGWITLRYCFKKRKTKDKESWVYQYALVVVFLLTGVFSHLTSFDNEAKKVVKSDYYRYKNNPEKCLEAAMSTEEYSYASNISYNLSILNTGNFTNDFFDFFQVSGTDVLYPDYRMKSDLMLATIDFYYEIGDIQEAKYWALESLKKHPYDNRLLKTLVKIELITGNYTNAQKYLNVLDSEFFTAEFVKKYNTYIDDTTLVDADVELSMKRKSIPGYNEIPETPLLRFQKLVETNPDNKIAFECMMLYYLLDGDLDGFIEHYNEAKNYFDSQVQVYEEAVLLYGANNSVPVVNEYNISTKNFDRFKHFADELKKREGNDRKAMNEMYSEFGKTYFYYYYFVYPQILKPEYARKEMPVIEE